MRRGTVVRSKLNAGAIEHISKHHSLTANSEATIGIHHGSLSSIDRRLRRSVGEIPEFLGALELDRNVTCEQQPLIARRGFEA